jgi:hypothetical protein
MRRRARHVASRQAVLPWSQRVPIRRILFSKHLANSAKYGAKSGIVGDNLSALGRIRILIAVGLWLPSRSSFRFHDVAVKGLRIVIQKIDAAKQQPGQ